MIIRNTQFTFYILFWSQIITRNFILKNSTHFCPQTYYKVELCSWQGETFWNLKQSKKEKKVLLGSDVQIMTYFWIEGWGSNSPRTPICQVSIEAEPVSLLQNYPPDLGCQPQYIQLILNHMEPHYSAEVWEEPEALQCTQP